MSRRASRSYSRAGSRAGSRAQSRGEDGHTAAVATRTQVDDQAQAVDTSSASPDGGTAAKDYLASFELDDHGVANDLKMGWDSLSEKEQLRYVHEQSQLELIQYVQELSMVRIQNEFLAAGVY